MLNLLLITLRLTVSLESIYKRSGAVLDAAPLLYATTNLAAPLLTRTENQITAPNIADITR